MSFSWIFQTVACTFASPFKACWASLHEPYPGPESRQPQGPMSQDACWNALAELNAETEFRWMHDQQATLDKEGHKDRVYDALWTLVRFHGFSLVHIENQLRAFGYPYIWLYPLPHGDGNTNPECPTVCRDVLTREDRAFSVGVFLGPENKVMEIKRDLQGQGSLQECGFLEMK